MKNRTNWVKYSLFKTQQQTKVLVLDKREELYPKGLELKTQHKLWYLYCQTTVKEMIT